MQIPLLLMVLAAAVTQSPSTMRADEPPPSEVRQLIQKLASREATDRDAAATRLVEIGGPAVGALMTARDAAETSPEARQAAEAALKTIGQNAQRDQDTLRPR